MKRFLLSSVALAAVLMIVSLAAGTATGARGSLPDARTIDDPTTASRAAYGRIDHPGQVRYYAVTPGQAVSVTIEAVIPLRNASTEFRPTVAVMMPGASNAPSPSPSPPFSVPAGYGLRMIGPDSAESRKTLFDPNSIERFYRNGSATISLPGGQTSYLAVYDSNGRTGDYVLGVASSPYYENASKKDLLAQGIALKFGAAEGRSLPWLDVTGALIALLGVSTAAVVGFAVGLPRAGTARRRLRWHRALILGGFGALAVFYAGIRILNRETGMIAAASFQELIIVLLLLAALWLTVQPPDRPGRSYRTFILLWSAGWFIEAALLAWYLLVTRTT